MWYGLIILGSILVMILLLGIGASYSINKAQQEESYDE